MTIPFRVQGRALQSRRSEFFSSLLKLDQVKRLKLLEAENGRLRRAVAELTLEKLILKEAASGNF